MATAAAMALLRATVLSNCGGDSSNEEGRRNSGGKDYGNGGNDVGDDCPCHLCHCPLCHPPHPCQCHHPCCCHPHQRICQHATKRAMARAARAMAMETKRVMETAASVMAKATKRTCKGGNRDGDGKEKGNGEGSKGHGNSD
jgi:hypothetical protein